jgi:hypothetical protein
MFFLPILCLALAGFLAWFGHHEQNKVFYILAFTLSVAALGTALISYFALSIVG